MKKHIILLVVLVHTFSHAQAPVSFFDRIKNTCNQWLKQQNSIDKQQVEQNASIFIESYWGAKHVSQETEDYITDILQSIDLEDWQSVRIRQLSKTAMGYVTEKNALAIYFQGLNYLYVNESWLNKISKEKKDFLLLHEAMHLKHQHSKKDADFKKTLTYVPSATITAIIGLLLAESEKEEFQYDIVFMIKASTLAKISAIGALGAAVYKLGQRYALQKARKDELEADAGAAQHLGSIDGAQQLFAEWQEQDDLYDSDFPQHPELVRFRKVWKEQQSTHPSYEKRLEHIKNELQKNNEVSVMEGHV